MRRQTFSLSFSDSIIVNIPTRESRHHIAYIELTFDIRRNSYFCSKTASLVRKKLSIFFIGLASLVVLIIGIMPHHHHNKGMACLMAKHCHENAPADKEHTHSEPTCVAKTFFLSGAELRLKHRYSLCEECHDPHHIHVFPILFAVADLLLHPTDDLSADPEYGEYLVFYTPSEARPSHGLRAPPFIFS